MKLIKPSYEILEQKPGIEGIYKMIELAGRTCYKSEDKITEDSAKKFVDMLIARGHTAMLEHGTVYLHQHFDGGYRSVTGESYQRYVHNPYSKVNYQFEKKIDGSYDYYITTNYRVLLENDWLDDLKYLCEPAEHHEKRVAVKFICDRGVSHEFVRHRVFSFAQESTRYCNYSKDKFGNEITFIHNGDTINIGQQDLYSRIEQCYKGLLELGETPQMARAVLPNALKTELVMTGFTSDWNHFFDLRARGRYTDSKGREYMSNPHPDAKALAEPLMGEFYKGGLL